MILTVPSVVLAQVILSYYTSFVDRNEIAKRFPGLRGYELAPYFVESVLESPERVHLAVYVPMVLEKAEEVQEQRHGRRAYFGYVEELGNHVRVITTADGSLLNAFEDSNYTRKSRQTRGQDNEETSA